MMSLLFLYFGVALSTVQMKDSYNWDLGKTESKKFLHLDKPIAHEGCIAEGYWKVDGTLDEKLPMKPTEFLANCQEMTVQNTKLTKWYFSPEEYLKDVYKLPHASEMDCAASKLKTVHIFNVNVRHRDSKLCPLDVDQIRYKSGEVFAGSIYIDFAGAETWLACMFHDFCHFSLFCTAIYMVNYDAPFLLNGFKFFSLSILFLVPLMLFFFYNDALTTLYWYDIAGPRLFSGVGLFVKGFYVSSNVLAINDGMFSEATRLKIVRTLTIICFMAVPIILFKMGQFALQTNYQVVFWYMNVSIMYPFGFMIYGMVQNMTLKKIDDETIKWLIWRTFILLPSALYTMGQYYRCRIVPGESLYVFPAFIVQSTAVYLATTVNPKKKSKSTKVA